MKLKGDSVFLDQNPIAIHKRDTTFSSSDGAFYYYSGTLNVKDSIATIKLKLNFCDYCGMPTEENPNPFFPWNKNYYCRITKQGLFINGYLFKKSSDKDVLTSEGSKPR